MYNKRISYFIIIAGTILLGILSRQFVLIPLSIGDMLYAVMAYFGLRFLFITTKLTNVAILALLYCYGIEFLQLYRAEWIVSIRNTQLGHYIMGQEFSWADLLAYTIGVFLSVCADQFFNAYKTVHTSDN